MAAIPAAFTDKLGPLPAWAWGLGLGGSILAWQRWRDRASGGEATEPVDENTAAAPPAPDGSFTMTPSPIGGGTWAVAPVTQPPSGDGGSRDGSGWANNEEWRRAAVDWLVAQRYDSIQSANAVTKLLDGSKVTKQEASVLRNLLRDFGAPPQGHPPIIVEGGTADPINPPPAPPRPAPPRPPAPRPAPPATPPGTPAAPRPRPDTTRTVARGDTLWDMTRSVYGRVDMRLVEKVAAHNRLRWSGSGRNRQVTPFRVGQTIRFPPL